MKSTIELYGIPPKSLEVMLYVTALETKVQGATKMMKHYREQAQQFLSNDTVKYEHYKAKYLDSEKAREHTRELLAEIKINGEI